MITRVAECSVANLERSASPSMGTLSRKLRALLRASVFVGLALPGLAQAQADTAPPEAAGDQAAAGNDIIVTAQRRAERLEDVPAAISVIQGEALENAGVTNIHNLGAVVAGAQINFAGGFTQPAIRGVSTLTNGNFVENNVAIYVDGYYEPSPLVINADLPNISSIEVLKGPQGTLYGRNATGGAILINTLAPSKVYTARGELTYARFNDKRASAYVSGPLSDWARFSVAGYYRKSDSYMRMGDPAVVGGQLDIPAAPIEQAAVRTKLQLDLTSNLTATLAYNFVHIDDPRTLLFTPRGHVAPSVAAPPLRAVGDYNASYNQFLDAPNTAHQGTLTLAWKTGIGTLSSYTGYGTSHQQSHFDTNGTYAPGNFFFASNFRQKTFQQSVDYAIDAISNVDLVVGGMYYHDWLGNPGSEPSTTVSLSSGPTLTPLSYGFGWQKTTAWAGYADATWHATDKLSINIGGRYSHDEKENFATSQTPSGTLLSGSPWQAKASWSRFTPRATLRYEIMPRTNIYASYTQGYRSGMFPSNPPSTKADAWLPVRPERITAYEIGLKTAQRNFRFDIAAFYYDYRDLQVATNVLSAACATAGPGCTQIVTVFANAPKATIYGMDAQLQVTPIENLDLRAGIALLHARYDDLQNVTGTGVNAADTLNVTQFQDWSGRQMARAPSVSGNAGFDYRIPNGDGGLSFGANLNFSSGFAVNNASLYGPLAGSRANEQRFRQDSYVMVNGQVTWTDPSGRYHITAFGKNLTNAKVWLTKSGNTSGDYGTLADPITYGVRAGFKF
jgi:iron complex outermembrane receptor protein